MSRRINTTIVSVAVFIILEVASLSVLSTRSVFQNLWFASFFHDTQAYLWGKVDSVRRFVTLKKENERLSAENASLLNELSDLKSVIASGNIEWRLYGSRMHYDILDANVVTSLRGSQHNYVIIDRGEADGVEVNDGLMTQTGVIGIVQSVSKHFSYALTYANKDMIVSAKVGKEGSVGSMSWDGISMARSLLTGIPIHVDVEPGDTVFTSGYSSIFPPDIPLGTVIDKKSNRGASADISVRLFNDYNNINRLLVVKNLDKNEILQLEK